MLSLEAQLHLNLLTVTLGMVVNKLIQAKKLFLSTAQMEAVSKELNDLQGIKIIVGHCTLKICPMM